MKIHILGICGTFMGSIAVLAKQMGHEVSGSDEHVYPPMSTQLEDQGISIQEGYRVSHLQPSPDIVIIGNTVSRGNEAVEYVLNEGLVFQSGPEWLSTHFLQDRHVLAVSGTHGKTTTSSMLAWILEYAGRKPGFLIGGVAENFGISARCGDSELFVVEADEYDTAFFDKRSKFIHYRARTLLINNIEYDHADIFADIAAIRREFHHLLRTIPSHGEIVRHQHSDEIDQVVEQGCWSRLSTFSAEDGDWCLTAGAEDYSCFGVIFKGKEVAEVNWDLIGKYNAENALGAIACAASVDVPAETACAALSAFKSVKRRLQVVGEEAGIRVYDDFAHHPTAVKATLEALLAKVGDQGRVIAVLEPRSNTMKMGVHRQTLAVALSPASQVFVFEPEGLKWDLAESMSSISAQCQIYKGFEELLMAICAFARAGDHILVMSNGGFQNIHQRLLQHLAEA